MKKKKWLSATLSMVLAAAMVPALSVPVFADSETESAVTAPVATETAGKTEDVFGSFTDLDPQKWYHDGIAYVLDQGIMKGVSNTRFLPDDSTTRAMIVTMLWRMEGQPEAENAAFADLEKDGWYEAAVSWAAANQIVNGYNEKTFAPADPVTREQLSAILYRYEQFKNRVSEDFLDMNLLDYDDAGQISGWAMEAMRWAVGGQILRGRTESTLEPEGHATRAEVATMLMRYDTLKRETSQDVYLTLVNKNNKLPDNWLDMIELVTAKSSIGREFQVEKEALEHFEKLREQMLSEGIDIELDSTYRSVKRQEELWAEFEEQYGLEYCQKYVAVPGYSEHHTGLAIDVCLIKDGQVIDDNDAMIAEKEIFAKVHEKLADYGFILRYLPGKEDVTGYAYEPWHFRYVGEEAARIIAEKGITLEEYLADSGSADTGSVWQYSYAGVEHPYLEAVSDYLCRYDAENLELSDGMIPCITSVEIDNDDSADIKMWGIFDIYNYSLKDGTLSEDNGKRLLGLFHLSQAEDGTCTVKDASFVEEGDEQAIEALCEGHEMALEGLKHPKVTEESRRWYISEYVKANDLQVTHYQPKDSDPLPVIYEKQDSPDWVASLPEAQETDSLIIVDVTVGSNAVLTMHEKNAEGVWEQTLDEAAFIGKNGLGKTKEGDLKTPVGTFGFNAALGINEDPGCALDYTQVDDSYYWNGDSNSDRYNKLVSTKDYTDFSVDDSERIVDYPNAYKYILNTTYNDEGTPGKGSAIFLHCYREERTYTGGCISIPLDKMEYVMQHVQENTKIIIRPQQDTSGTASEQ